MRTYPEFFSSLLNSERYTSVGLTEPPKNTLFNYFTVRRPNRFSGKIIFNEASIYTVGGIRGGGKSSLLEALGDHYAHVIDVYGSRDDECLAWLRAGQYDAKYDKCLIVGPPTTSLKSSWDYLSYDELTIGDVANHNVVVMPQKIFPSLNSFFKGTQHLVDLLWSRPYVTDLWYLLIREAANILYSRIYLKRAKIDQARAYLILLMREMRHMGISMGMDSQYLIALDREVRLASDYTFLKNMGSYVLPHDASWLYRYITPGGLRTLEKDEFVGIDKWGAVFLGKNGLPPWHKTPKEDLYSVLGIKYEYGTSEILDEEEGEDEDMILHKEIISAWLAARTIAGAAKSTGHDRNTVRKHVERHRLKQCSCFKENGTTLR